jgi:hypothetical protein
MIHLIDFSYFDSDCHQYIPITLYDEKDKDNFWNTFLQHIEDFNKKYLILNKLRAESIHEVDALRKEYFDLSEAHPALLNYHHARIFSWNDVNIDLECYIARSKYNDDENYDDGYGYYWQTPILISVNDFIKKWDLNNLKIFENFKNSLPTNTNIQKETDEYVTN